MCRVSRSFPTRTYEYRACFLTCTLAKLLFTQAKGYNYGFIEYDDPGAAERAMQTLNGRRVHQSVMIFELIQILDADILTMQ
jgi:hypothetical protein